MVSVKGGILKIGAGSFEGTMRFLYEICFFLSIIIYYDLYNTPYHYAGIGLSFLGTGLILLTKIPKKRITHLGFFIWYLLFIILARLSTIWAYSAYTAEITYFNIMLYTLVCSFGVTQYVETKEDFEKIISLFAMSVFVIGVSQFIFSSPSTWFAGFFGSGLGGNNSNKFGAIMLYASIIAFYKAYSLLKRRWYFIVLFTFLCSILSSSRKAFILNIVGVVLIIFFSRHRKYRFIHLIISFFIMLIGLFCLFEADFLYEIIGWRIENLIKFSSGENVSEGSMPMRKFAIEFAKQLFKDRPILGWGYSNYSIMMLERTYLKHNVYAHNNYYEILADLGIVGFVLYYSSHLFIAVKLLIKFFKDKFSTVTLLSIVILATKLIFDYASVSMLDPNVHVILAITFSAIYIDSSQNDRQYYYEKNNADY